MAEVITETIIPGTYVEVRSEGLITVGPIPVGNVGVIGIAEKGGSEIEVLSSYDGGRVKFGEVGDWDPTAGEGTNLTLVRSPKLLFNNGARTVYAKRVFDEKDAGTTAAKFSLKKNGDTIINLTAKTPGTWGNRLQIRVEEGEANELVNNELVTRTNGSYTLSAEAVVKPDSTGASIGTVVVRGQGMAKKYQLRTAEAKGDVVQAKGKSKGTEVPGITGKFEDFLGGKNGAVSKKHFEEPLERIKNIASFDYSGEITRIKENLTDVTGPSLDDPEAFLKSLFNPISNITDLIENSEFAKPLSEIGKFIGADNIEDLPEDINALITHFKNVF